MKRNRLYIYSLHKPTALSIHHVKEMLLTSSLKSKQNRNELQVFLPCVFSRRKCLYPR